MCSVVYNILWQGCRDFPKLEEPLQNTRHWKVTRSKFHTEDPHTESAHLLFCGVTINIFVFDLVCQDQRRTAAFSAEEV